MKKTTVTIILPELSDAQQQQLAQVIGRGIYQVIPRGPGQALASFHLEVHTGELTPPALYGAYRYGDTSAQMYLYRDPELTQYVGRIAPSQVPDRYQPNPEVELAGVRCPLIFSRLYVPGSVPLTPA